MNLGSLSNTGSTPLKHLREGNPSLALKMPTHYKWGILLVLLTVCLRLPAIVHPKAIDDEAGYATVAHELLHGGTLYVSALDRRPPLLFWIYTAIFFVVGPYNWVPFHLIAVAWMLLSMWGLYALGRELFSQEVGLMVVLLYSIYTASVYYKLLEFNGEVMMDLPIVWALYMAFKQHTSRHRPELVVSGVLLCCAFLIKQPAAIAACRPARHPVHGQLFFYPWSRGLGVILPGDSRRGLLLDDRRPRHPPW